MRIKHGISIAFIPDRSGSMSGHQEAAIAGANDFLRGQQDAIATAAQMNIYREHFAAANGENLFCSRDACRAIAGRSVCCGKRNGGRGNPQN